MGRSNAARKRAFEAPRIVICAYCDRPAERVTGKAIYPHRPDLFGKHFYRCIPCKAHVGCHPGSSAPLGRLANAELRKAKSAAHAAFDPIWKSGIMDRSAAYGWLAHALNISPANCHIGMFDVELCELTVAVCKERLDG